MALIVLRRSSRSLIVVILFLVSSVSRLITLELLSLWSEQQADDASLSYPDKPNDSALGGSILHIVSTRFMQHQPNLIHLARARLELFRAFCLPTMIHQTTDNFVWVIRTDPDLEKGPLQDLINLLSPHSRFYLVLTNDNQKALAELANAEPSTFLSGDLARLRGILSMRYDNVLETRLDADDGLRLDFFEHIQQRPVGSPRVYCVDTHLEWHSSTDSLKPARKEHCVTPGLTVMVNTNQTQAITLPPHHKIHKEWPSCLDQPSEGCLGRLDSFKGPSAIRSRTPTSAGMANVHEDEEEDNALRDEQDRLWSAVEIDFGLDHNTVRQVKSVLDKSLLNIAQDNLAGQCTQGHSCKHSSREKLLELVNSTYT